MTYIFLLWILLPLQTLGYQDSSFVPGSNERLKNLTGLSYYLYPWVGSYYNGTTTFHLEYLIDNQRDSLCRTFRNETTSFTSKSILAVTKPSPDDDSKNPVRIALKSALTDFDFVNNLASGDESKHLQWQFLSISHETPSRSIHRPYFNLSLTNPTGPPYKITGSSNNTNGGVTSITQNFPSCDNPQETWWGLSFLDRSNYNPGHIPITDPKVSLMFDNQSASFSFEAWFLMNNKNDTVYGRGEVEFLGKMDGVHSDILERGGQPVWSPTVGLGNNSLNGMFGGKGEESLAMRGGVDGWIFFAAILGVGLGGLL